MPRQRPRQPRSQPHVQAEPSQLWVGLIAIGSGAAALIYQLIWLQLLQHIIGSSAISVGVLLAAFMAGLALGSCLASRLISLNIHPLRTYAGLEVLIGVLGLALPLAMPQVAGFYSAVGTGGIGYRAIVATACLLPPTMLMGATMPVMAKWLESKTPSAARIGFYYGANTAGAVLGVLAAGFYLLRAYDLNVVTAVAALTNLVVACGSLVYAKHARFAASPVASDREPFPQQASDRRIHLAIGLSGATAMASEVLWTRILALLFGATVYAFSLILATFLIGLSLGSILAAKVIHLYQPRILFGLSQLLLCAAMAWASHVLTDTLPYVPVAPSSSLWFKSQVDLGQSLMVVLPAAILWGASFPFALASLAQARRVTDRAVASVYAANTVGAVLGSVSGVAMVAYLGSQQTQRVLIGVSLLSSIVLLGPVMSAGGAFKLRWRSSAGCAAVVIVIGVLLWHVAPVPGVLVAHGRVASAWVGLTELVYIGEGLNSFVAVSREHTGSPIYHSAGKVQASAEGRDMRLQRMLGHLSHLIPASPKKVLVIGLGAGTTAGALSISPAVKRLTIVELERLVPELASMFFADYNYDVVRSPKASMVIDDARHFVGTTDEKFDVITSDLVDPWVKGTASLFTREFFELVKSRLNPGGVATMFVQLYMSNREAVKTELLTFMEVFPNTMVWGNAVDGEGYDLVITGQVQPIAINIDEWQATLDRPEYEPVSQSLREIGITSAVELLSTYAGATEDLKSWFAGASLNSDSNLRLEYLAGASLNLLENESIYTEMLRYLKYPERSLLGSPATVRALRGSIARSVRASGVVNPGI